jgi:chorismate mutase
MHPETMERSEPTRLAGPEPLMSLREQIDRVDNNLVTALAARLRLAEEVGTLKGNAGLLPLDPSREAEVVRRACHVARAEGIPEEGVRQIIWGVIEYCREGVLRCHASTDDQNAPPAELDGSPHA